MKREIILSFFKLMQCYHNVYREGLNPKRAQCVTKNLAKWQVFSIVVLVKQTFYKHGRCKTAAFPPSAPKYWGETKKINADTQVARFLMILIKLQSEKHVK